MPPISLLPTGAVGAIGRYEDVARYRQRRDRSCERSGGSACRMTLAWYPRCCPNIDVAARPAVYHWLPVLAFRGCLHRKVYFKKSGGYMRVFLLAAALAAWVSSAGAGEVYKCIEDGKTVFQGVPCHDSGTKLTVKPANRAPSPATASTAQEGGPSPSLSSLAKLRQNVEMMENERRQREDTYAIEGLEIDIETYEAAMDAELAALQRKKMYAANNLAGATWEQSISTEMQAVSDKYRTRIQIAHDRIVQMQRDLDDLKRRHE